jgi:hypothetical protein
MPSNFVIDDEFQEMGGPNENRKEIRDHRELYKEAYLKLMAESKILTANLPNANAALNDAECGRILENDADAESIYNLPYFRYSMMAYLKNIAEFCTRFVKSPIGYGRMDEVGKMRIDATRLKSFREIMCPFT